MVDTATIDSELKACARRMSQSNDLVAVNKAFWRQLGPGSLYLEFSDLDAIRSHAGPTQGALQWLDRGTAVKVGTSMAPVIALIDKCQVENDQAVLLLTLAGTDTRTPFHYTARIQELVTM